MAIGTNHVTLYEFCLYYSPVRNTPNQNSNTRNFQLRVTMIQVKRFSMILIPAIRAPLSQLVRLHPVTEHATRSTDTVSCHTLTVVFPVNFTPLPRTASG